MATKKSKEELMSDARGLYNAAKGASGQLNQTRENLKRYAGQEDDLFKLMKDGREAEVLKVMDLADQLEDACKGMINTAEEDLCK